jgi:2Fe-2S ferredoxin
MGKVRFIDHEGTERDVDVADGVSLMEAARDNDVPGIEAECGGACACATCHVFVDEVWFEAVGGPGEAEESMLEFAAEVRPTSRLSCQVLMSPEIDGVVVHTPASQH